MEWIPVFPISKDETYIGVMIHIIIFIFIDATFKIIIKFEIDYY